MIDIHCHMLPGVDDGAHDVEEALRMALIASEDGITDVIVTPHMQDGLYHHKAENLLEETVKFQKLIEDHHISLRVHPGAEVHIHPLLMDNLYRHKILTLCNSNKYMLLELPVLSIPDYTTTLIHELVLEGIVPVITHPERNLYLLKDSRPIVEWIKIGAITQVNTGSILGEMGKRVQKLAYDLFKNQMIHVLASDGHNTTTRPPLLSKAYQVVSKLASNEDVELLKENAMAILDGEASKVNTPKLKRRHWRFRRF